MNYINYDNMQWKTIKLKHFKPKISLRKSNVMVFNPDFIEKYKLTENHYVHLLVSKNYQKLLLIFDSGKSGDSDFIQLRYNKTKDDKLEGYINITQLKNECNIGYDNYKIKNKIFNLKNNKIVIQLARK